MWKLDVLEKATYLSFFKQIQSILSRIDSKKKIAIWGASVRGIITGIVLEECGITQFEFIDNDIEKQGDNLSGHQIVSFESVDKSTIILLSMENQLSVKEQLNMYGWKEGVDFYCLVSSDVDCLLHEMKKTKENVVLVLGASCMHVVPVKERQEDDFSEMLQSTLEEPAKLLGLTCLGMKLMFYIFRLEVCMNKNMRKLVMLVSWETLTSFHHLLPRTQKPQLVKMLAEYAKECEAENIYDELKEEYELAIQRAENYVLENQYAIKYIEEGQKEKEALYEYLNRGLMEPLDIQCEEMKYLSKILELACTQKINVSLIIEPINLSMCRTLYGDRFEQIYHEKCNTLKMLAQHYNALFFDASNLLEGEELLSIYTANEALLFEGRKSFVSFVSEKINQMEIR